MCTEKEEKENTEKNKKNTKKFAKKFEKVLPISTFFILAFAFFAFFALFAISFSTLVFSTASFSIDVPSLKLIAGTSETFSIKFINTGDENLSIAVNVSTNSTNISATLNESNFNLATGSVRTIGLTLNANSDAFGVYSLTINANGVGIGGNTTTVTKTKDVDVKYAYCDINSEAEYLSLSIENKEDFEGDDYKPLDVFNIEIKVKNDDDDDHDVVISAILIDEEGNEVDETEVDKEYSIREESSKTEVLKMEIPIVDEGKYYVYVKAYDDDNEIECQQDDSYIDVKRSTREIKIADITFDKDEYNCSENLLVSGRVINIGTKTEDRIKIIYTDDLGNSYEDYANDLDPAEEKNFLFNARIPANASQGRHTITIKAYYDYSDGNYDEFTSSSMHFNIIGGCIIPFRDASISLNVPSKMYDDTEYSGTLLISNTGNLNAVYAIEIIAGWANVTLETLSVSLFPGEQRIVQFKIKPNKHEEGSKVLLAKVKFDGKDKSASTNVNVESVSVQPTTEESKTFKASWWEQFKFELQRRPAILAIVVASITTAIICLLGIILMIIALRRRL